MNAQQRQTALILLGPTGSGKTPLGQLLELRGLAGRCCVHFDFGENLRQAVAGDEPDAVLSRADLDFLRQVLTRGALLEDQDFPLAQRLLLSFLQRRQVAPETLVVMNGLPRHAGQARSLEPTLDVRRVVVLECAADVVQARIAGNVGGDRTERTDDDLPAVDRKLKIYHQRTKPLVAYYQAAGVPVQPIQVTTALPAAAMWQLLQPPPALR